MNKLPKAVEEFLEKDWAMSFRDQNGIIYSLLYHPDSPVRVAVEASENLLLCLQGKLDINSLPIFEEILEQALAALEVKDDHDYELDR